jgi:hypothetical protein
MNLPHFLETNPDHEFEMHITPSSHIVATDDSVIKNGSSSGRSYLLMRGGYFYGSAHSEKHVETPQGVAIMQGDDGNRGPFHTAAEARINAESRVSNAVLDGAADGARQTAIKLHGPNSEHARRYDTHVVSDEDIALFASTIDAPKGGKGSVINLATDRGVDPLTSFRAMAANGTVAQDDIRQLAAAYTHPDEKQRLPVPSWVKADQRDVRLNREDGVKLAAIRMLERRGMKNRAAEAYENFGLEIAKNGDPAAAMPFLMNSCKLAREHTREHGRDVRPMRSVRKDRAGDQR